MLVMIIIIMFPFLRFMNLIKPNWEEYLGRGGEGDLAHFIWMIPAGIICWIGMILAICAVVGWLVPAGPLCWIAMVLGVGGVSWWVVSPIFE